MRKGQAAMEFLMTYGWAILVVLAAIGALAYFGVLSPDRFLPDKCAANPPFSCTQYKAYSSGTTLSLGIQNNGGVDLTSVRVGVWCNRDWAAPTAGNGLFNQVVGNGDVFNGTATGSVFNVTCADIGGVGTRFKATYTINYTKSGETITHTTTGSIQARAE